jgi:hypothetical protein
MPAHVFKNPYFMLNSVDLSAYVRQIAINLKKDQVENTAASATGAKTYLIGLEDDDIAVTLNQDFDADKVDATLWAAWNAGVAVTAIIKPVNTTTAATNPKYTLSVLVSEYSPINGQVGSNHETGFTLKGTGAAARATSD